MNEIARLVGSVGAVLLVPMLLFWFAFTLSLPFLCWSAVRNLARVRRALERIADGQGPTPGAGPRGVMGL